MPWPLQTGLLRKHHLRILVAAAHGELWFAARVSWQAFASLQSWGLLEPSSCRLTDLGQRAVADLLSNERFVDTVALMHIEAAERLKSSSTSPAVIPLAEKHAHPPAAADSRPAGDVTYLHVVENL